MVRSIIQWFEDRKNLKVRDTIKRVVLLKPSPLGDKICLQLMKVSKKLKF